MACSTNRQATNINAKNFNLIIDCLERVIVQYHRVKSKFIRIEFNLQSVKNFQHFAVNLGLMSCVKLDELT